MPEYRRVRQPGGMFFLTIVVAHRRPIFRDPANIHRLRTAVCLVKRERAFEIHGAVVLPDHLHFV